MTVKTIAFKINQSGIWRDMWISPLPHPSPAFPLKLLDDSPVRKQAFNCILIRKLRCVQNVNNYARWAATIILIFHSSLKPTDIYWPSMNDTWSASMKRIEITLSSRAGGRTQFPYGALIFRLSFSELLMAKKQKCSILLPQNFAVENDAATGRITVWFS